MLQTALQQAVVNHDQGGEAVPAQHAVITDALARHVRDCWTTAKEHKVHVTERLNNCLRRRKGEYAPEKLQAIKAQGGATIFMLLTSIKCTAAKAWLADLFAPAGDQPWQLDPTPVTNLPPQLAEQLVQTAAQGALQLGISEQEAQALVLQHADRLKAELDDEARERMELMSKHIEDALTEGGWREAFDEFLDDLVTYPSAIIKGPLYRVKDKLRWVTMRGQSVPKLEPHLVREVRRVSPYDFFPLPGVVQPDDGGCIERLRLTPQDLANMREAPGYNGQGIAQALLQYRAGGLREWLFSDGERSRLESGSANTWREDGRIDALEYTGRVQGNMLIQWGMDPKAIPDPVAEYPVSVMVVGNYTIRALINPDPTGRSDYFKASWRGMNGSFWGHALPEDMADVQDVCNASARALVNNMAIASGPQVVVDQATAVQGQDYTSMFPWKVWSYNSKGLQGSGSRPPIDFFQPNANVGPLLEVYERFSNYADQITGLPAFAYGSDQGAGAAKTASGLSMLMNAASKTIKDVVRNIDIRVIEPLINKLYIHLMLDPKVPAEAKGDAQVSARGSDALIHKEAQQQRLLEMMQITANPVDQQIIGVEGRRKQLEETYKSIEVGDVIPDRDELEQRLMQESMNAPMQPAG